MWSGVLFEICRTIIALFVIVTLIKNYIFLIIAPFHPIREKLRYIRHSKQLSQGDRSSTPLISVIVPAWNEEVGVVKTINSIIGNGYNNFELILIDDGSTDRTNTVISKKLIELKKMRDRKLNGLRIMFITQSNAGKGVALNQGIKHAKGDIVLTIDADSALQKGALENLVKYYRDKDVMAVVGNVEVANTKTLIGLAQQLEYYFGFYNKRAHAVLGAEYIFGGACASFRRTVFDKLGNFDTSNKTEDIEMSMRIRAAGYQCTYAEDVVCFTEGASDIKSLISQRVRWKKGRIDTFIKYRKLFFSTEDHHNFFLSFFILPLSVVSEVQLIFEPIAIAILVAYSLVTSEYLSLSIGILFILLVYIAVSLFHENRPRPLLLLAFPFTWPLFYVLDWVEFMALFKSVKIIRRGADVEWQTWNRQGITAQTRTKA